MSSAHCWRLRRSSWSRSLSVLLRPSRRGSPRSPETAACPSDLRDQLLSSRVWMIHQQQRPEKQPHKDKDGALCTGSEVRRSRWSVFTQRGVLQQSSQSLSKQFHHAVSVHGFHLRQRAKWVIGELNCGAARDIEEVWRTLSRLARTSCLPSCNANIQRERGEIWVFCDVLHSEQVGRFLKEELRLSGRIDLSVRRLGNVFSM
ncbi:shieldin complex subunit 3 isoform X2 [Maylandia zebra]|uniref:shieldin complex subunit 3 isoform X2 n=1 Tax=Maylandia zebra TaxID=106582 RepID=UPI00403C9BCC